MVRNILLLIRKNTHRLGSKLDQGNLYFECMQGKEDTAYTLILGERTCKQEIGDAKVSEKAFSNVAKIGNNVKQTPSSQGKTHSGMSSYM